MTTTARDPIEVSVIIPVYNDTERLELCLRALSKQTIEPSRFEVIVVDNGSSEDIASVVARHPFVRLLKEERPGSYAARNKGLADARGSCIAFTDSDCLPEPDWLTSGLRCLDQSPRAGLVAGAIELFPRDERRPTAVEVFELIHGFPQERYASKEGFGATANVFTRRSIIQSVGTFANHLKSGGDREWGQRVRAAGFEIVYCAAARVRHPARFSWTEHYGKLRRTIAGYTAIEKKAGYSVARFLHDFLPALIPPLGAIRRAFHEPRLRGFDRKVKYVIASFGTRYAAALLRLRFWAKSAEVRQETSLTPPVT